MMRRRTQTQTKTPPREDWGWKGDWKMKLNNGEYSFWPTPGRANFDSILRHTHTWPGGNAPPEYSRVLVGLRVSKSHNTFSLVNYLWLGLLFVFLGKSLRLSWGKWVAETWYRTNFRFGQQLSKYLPIIFPRQTVFPRWIHLSSWGN